MKTSKVRSLYVLPVTLLIALALNGCDSTATSTTTAQTKRATELKSDYEQMPATTQDAVKQGNIARGNTPKEVYIALGKPDRIISSADGRVTNWIYANYLPPVPDRPKNAKPDNTPSHQKTHRNVRMSDPLLETMEAWRANTSRLGIDPSDPDIAPKAANQSWADYGRMLQTREIMRAAPAPTTTRGLISIEERRETFARTGKNYTSGVKMIDTEAWQEYNESLNESPVQSLETVKLEVVFIEQRVSDAIVNESMSAFVDVPFATPAP